ncbi:Rid family hydrolase [Cupriavidus basilensis]|uniref:Rid family hydrolase n=1 Tax=Cupriavidus basilensis TaxID=68895 RepID=A0ABT6AQ88_9BURK|nr:Rid family hydrolase [Cupriavidus basilensis]MDF3834785.1 Rid family hydrolase [Cupriavidus basilensis]
MSNDIVRYPTPLTAPLSRAVRAGGFLFLSGQTPKDENLQPLRGDIKTQTQNVLDAISESLKGCGSNLSEVGRFCAAAVRPLRYKP